MKQSFSQLPVEFRRKYIIGRLSEMGILATEKRINTILMWGVQDDEVNFDQDIRSHISGNILSVCAELNDITVEDILSKSKKRKYIDARQMAAFFIKKMTILSLSLIGEVLGGRDHSTIIHSLRKFEDYYITEPKFKAIADSIAKKLKVTINT